MRLLCRGGHSSTVCCVAISNDGELIASGGEDKAVLLWRLRDGALLQRLLVHTKCACPPASLPALPPLFALVLSRCDGPRR